MTHSKFPSRAQGDQEALFYTLQIVIGVAAWLLVASTVTDRMLAEVLGFLAMCAAQFLFARRTWAAGISARRYWIGVLFGAAIGAALRIVFE